jgi:hypothetical protein
MKRRIEPSQRFPRGRRALYEALIVAQQVAHGGVRGGHPDRAEGRQARADHGAGLAHARERGERVLLERLRAQIEAQVHGRAG